jgi:hypothetical protein
MHQKTTEQRGRLTLWTAKKNILAVKKLAVLIDGQPSMTKTADLVFQAGLEVLRKKYQQTGKRGLPSNPKPKTRGQVWKEECAEEFGE